MKKQLFAAAIFAAISTGGASAQDFKGDISLGFSAFWDDTSVNALSGEGAFEFGLGERASLQLDVGLYGFNATGINATNLVLHGIYDVMPNASAGLFMGLDRLEGDSVDFYGLEYGQSFGTGGFEIYAGRGEDGGITGTVAGVEGNFSLSDSVGLGIKLDNTNLEGAIDLTRIGVKGTYSVGQGTKLYGEFGTLRADGFGLTESEPFLGVGMSISLGQDEATFGRRGIMNLIPGL